MTKILAGKVSAGRGVAIKMVASNDEYIKILLGTDPFPGTLNIVLDMPVILQRVIPLDKRPKQFGVVGSIENVPCIIYRWRGAPLHIVEIIAASSLRETLALVDGQKIRLTLPHDNLAKPACWRILLWKLFYNGRTEAFYQDKALKQLMKFKVIHKMVCQRQFKLCG